MLCLVCVLAAACFGKDDEEDDYDDYRKIDHAKISSEDPTPLPTDDPELTPTPEERKLVLCLDPGHGGRWQGAIYFKREERDLVLQLAKEIRTYLNEHYPEIEVYLTREDNNVFSNDIGPDLRARVEFAVEKKANILVSLHLNASEGHNLRGTMVCISKQPNINGISKELADCLMDATESLGLRRRGYETRNSGDTFDENGVPVDYYAICRHGSSLNIPAVILESCFMDNEEDFKYVKDDAAIKKLAAAEAEAMAKFLISHYGPKN